MNVCVYSAAHGIGENLFGLEKYLIIERRRSHCRRAGARR